MSKKQTDTLREFTVKEALVWSDKHRKLKGEGARAVHIKQLISLVLDEAIKALPEEEREIEPNWDKGDEIGKAFVELGRNQAIQQSKKNIEELR